jgi:hypothetical protein
LTALDDNAVERDDGIERLERAVLPGAYVVEHRVGHAADERFGDFDLVEFQQHGLHVADAHAAGVHGQDFVVEALEARLALRDQLRLEAAVAVARGVDGELIVLLP